VIVNEPLQKSYPKIYAAGNLANQTDPTFGMLLRVENWDLDWRQGLRAGYNMAGELIERSP